MRSDEQPGAPTVASPQRASLLDASRAARHGRSGQTRARDKRGRRGAGIDKTGLPCRHSRLTCRVCWLSQLVDQVNLARAQLGKYSEQLATWARIEADTSPDLTARQSLSVQVNSDFVASLNDPDGDGYLTPGELAAGRLLRKSRNSQLGLELVTEG